MYFVAASQAVLLDALTSPKPPCTRETAKTQFHYPLPIRLFIRPSRCPAAVLSSDRDSRTLNAKQQKFALDALLTQATGLPRSGNSSSRRRGILGGLGDRGGSRRGSRDRVRDLSSFQEAQVPT